MIDEITESQEWIDGLIVEYSPTANDIDVAIQNMGLRIADLERQVAELQSEMSVHVDLNHQQAKQLAEAQKKIKELEQYAPPGCGICGKHGCECGLIE